jgi:hypothetical protein
MLIEQLLVAAAAVESCTRAVNVNNPAAVGVPVIVPVPPLSNRLLGRVPTLIEYV